MTRRGRTLLSFGGLGRAQTRFRDHLPAADSATLDRWGRCIGIVYLVISTALIVFPFLFARPR